MIGDAFQTGHNVLIREKTAIGDRVAIGTAAVIEGDCTIGDDVRLQSLVYIPPTAPGSATGSSSARTPC